MKLEQKHLVSYLLHGVIMSYTGTGRPFRDTKKEEILTFENIELMLFSNQRKVVLRSFSGLTKEIESIKEEIVKLKISKQEHEEKAKQHQQLAEEIEAKLRRIPEDD